jgi:LCP family protein required for cell wall assembly
MANSSGGVYGRPRRPADDETGGDEGTPQVESPRSTGRASVGGPRRDDVPRRPERIRANGNGGRSNGNGSRSNGNGGNGGGDGYSGAPVAPKKKLQPRWDRIALVAVAFVVIVGLLVGGGLWFYARNLDSKLNKTDPFSAIVGNRPLKTVDGALNILMVGSDSRDPNYDISKPGEWRSDTIVMIHVTADHNHAYLVSIPRDLYVYIPKMAGATYSDRYAKINASFSWGGLPLAVTTIENYTGVRIDHVVSIDFSGLKEVVDALGGVDMYVDQTITSIHGNHRTYKKGNRHFTGSEALDYVRQRYQFADGDFARMKHQQALLKAMLDKATSAGVLSNPGKLNAFLQTLTKTLTVDKDFALTDMAIQFRSMSSDKLTFLTSPNQGSADRNGESVVLSDKTKALALYDAMAKDTMADYLAANSPSTKPSGS